MIRRPALILFALALVACATSRDAVLSRTLAGLQAADKAFVAHDAELQAEIVAKAESEADGRRELAEYRVRRDKVTAAFIVAYTAVATASVDLTEDSLVQLVRAAAQAIAALKELK